MSQDKLLNTLYNRHAAALSVVAADADQRVHIDAVRLALALMARELADDLGAARQELDALIAERDGLRQQLAQMDAELRTLRSYAIAPKTDPPAAPDDWIMRLQMTFADDQNIQDWLSGIAAGRNTFCSLPKPTRARIIAAVVRHLYDPVDGRPPQMHQYEYWRPKWLPSAQSVVLTIGDWESIIKLADSQSGAASRPNGCAANAAE